MTQETEGDLAARSLPSRGTAAAPAGPLDCVIVGYNDFDLQAIMAAREMMADSSGAFRQMLGSVFRHEGQWLHHVQFLNAVLQAATQRDYRLHTMELPNLAVCYLKSFLARRGLEAEAVNFFNTGKGRLAALLDAGPRAVAITTTLYVESDPIVEIVKFIRRHSPETVIIAGGPYILSLCSLPHLPTQEYLLQGLGADVYIHDAQGETTLSRLLHELRRGPAQDLSRIPNLIYRQDCAGHGARAEKSAAAPSFVRTPRVIEDNDIDGDATDWQRIPPSLCAPTAQLIMSRSCPFRCTFCRYPAIAGPWKVMSVDAVERQMRQLHAAGTRTLILFDDTPNVPLPRFKQILNMMLRNRFAFGWFSNLRCADADPEAYDLMKASGCQGVFLGLESGDQGILDNMNKRATVEQYREGIRQLKSRGILTYASFIVGFPGETQATARNTVRFIAETQPDYYQVHVYYHSRNVPIQLQAARFGLRGSDYSWRHATMDWQAACDAADWMRGTVQGSVVGTSYLSTFWMLGYLYGKGVTLEHIREFMAQCQPVLLRNADTQASRGACVEPLAPEILAAARHMAADMAAADSANRLNAPATAAHQPAG